jgi:hypothetical protein
VLATAVAVAAATLETAVTTAATLLDAAVATATEEAGSVNMVIVTVTVAGQTSAATAVVAATADEATATGAELAATLATGEAAAPPAAACAVKFVKPFAVRRSAMLIPAAAMGDLADEAERAFATSEPTTAGSMRGVIPRRISVTGRVGSLQIDGML